jgi:hypothetical protein
MSMRVVAQGTCGGQSEQNAHCSQNIRREYISRIDRENTGRGEEIKCNKDGKNVESKG